jgi:hypothetical protein
MRRQSKVAVVVIDQDSKTAKVIREFRWNVRREYGANHGKWAPDRYCQEFPKKKDSHSRGWRGALGTASVTSCISASPVPRRSKYGRTPVITPSAIIQHIRAISDKAETCLKLKRVCNGIWPKNQKHSKS